MTNSNCLDGMRCPKCKSEGPFKIEVSALAVVHDDGTESYEQAEWEDTSPCICVECRHHSTVKHFTK